MWSSAEGLGAVGGVVRALVVGMAGVVLVVSSGCYRQGECGEPERCDYTDNDCDGRVDGPFRDDDGIYFTPQHCGGCGVDCDAVFPTAAATTCQVDRAEGTAHCVLVACPEGWHRSGEGSCAPDVPVLCLPCEADADCALRLPGSRCLPTATGQHRCGQPCETDAGCP